jgi:hypothetical protein
MDVDMDSTNDMYFAATLLAYGAELLEIDRTNPRRQRFQFGGEIEQIFVKDTSKVVLRIESPTFDDVKTRFAGRTLLFPPSYVDAVRRIKAVIHDD